MDSEYSDRIISIVVIILFIITPFLFSWSGIILEGTGSSNNVQYKYELKLAPLYYYEKESNGAGFSNFTKIGLIWNLKPSDFYTHYYNKDLLTYMAIFGMFYLFLAVMFSVLVVDGYFNRYIKEIDFAIMSMVFVGILYYILLYAFLSSMGIPLVGETDTWDSISLGAGFYSLILMGVIYFVTRKRFVI